MSNCDFCGKKAHCMRTHYGSGFGYIRLVCPDCKEKLGCEILDENVKQKNLRKDLINGKPIC